ncbi:unnamed protein product [Ixodes pacificus]
MARPPHEDPQYHVLTRVRRQRSHSAPCRRGANVAEDTGARAGTMLRVCRCAHLSIEVSPQKFMRLSPKTLSASPKSSPLHRRVRSESRKCRKIHGMENKDMWCTQCKWKKACSRYVD